jgi:hypothetical protein
MILVSTANIMAPDKKFVLIGKVFIYAMNMKGPGSDHWGTPCFNVPQSVKNY